MKKSRTLINAPLPYLLFIVASMGLVACNLATKTEQVSFVSSQIDNKEFDPTDFVDLFIGTDGKGKTFPGATVPHGMVQLSPDNGRTGWDWISGYFYPDNVIAGFSHTHLSGTGAGDLYDISFMPITKPFKRLALEGGPKQGSIASHFSHQQESASPGYYQVMLDDYSIQVELTAGLRTGYQRYNYSTDTQTGVVRLDLGYSRNWDKTLGSSIQIIDEHTIAGYRKSTGWAPDQRVYFYTRFSAPIKDYVIHKDGQPSAGTNHQGVAIAGQFEFDLSQYKVVEVRTAISSVSIDNAKNNFFAEGGDKTFEQTRNEAKQAWKNELSKVEIQAKTDNMRQFYTAMYHASLAPRVFSDSDGRYKGPDGNIHTSSGFAKNGEPRYEFFSLWDTFRALHPWKTIVDPDRSSQMMTSIMDHYNVAGRLPVWNFQGNETDMMMGYHSVPVLVDAYKKGLLKEDPKDILTAALQSAKQQKFGLESYQKLGFVPFNERKWNVSLTLEYAFDDWAIAALAKDLGEDALYQEFNERAQNYRKHFDHKTGFMRALDPQGQFRLPFDENAYHPEDYCEANAWQYSFFVPHDIEGLVTLMGGNTAFADKLNTMFEVEQSMDEVPEWISGYIGQYVHGNEPSHHVPYLYSFVEQPHKTQALVRKIMDDLYTTKPDGLAGNEDAGQMSAWYLFSALGFYPVNPVSGQYVLGSPEIKTAVLSLDNGNTFKVRAENQSDKNVYVKKAILNGQELERIFITHQEIMAGGELVFVMSPTH
jgi:predicted alpha-1,2-mannosidase